MDNKFWLRYGKAKLYLIEGKWSVIRGSKVITDRLLIIWLLLRFWAYVLDVQKKRTCVGSLEPLMPRPI